MPSRPTPRGPFPVDLVVFLATLATGCILVLVGHVTPQALAGYTTALAGLYAAWHHRPTRQPSQPTPPDTDETPTTRNR